MQELFSVLWSIFHRAENLCPGVYHRISYEPLTRLNLLFKIVMCFQMPVLSIGPQHHSEIESL